MMMDVPSNGFKELKVYDLPPSSYSNLRIPRKSRIPPFHIDKDSLCQFKKSHCPENPFRFNVDISHLSPLLPPPLYQPAALFYTQPTCVKMHLDGTMEGSLLTLVIGTKIWTLGSPYDGVVYTTTQEEGETVFIPPGYRHSVNTTSPFSIAYGALWTTPDSLKTKLICLNRDFIKEKGYDTISILEECVQTGVLKPAKKGKSKREKLLKDAGKKFAIYKGGSTRRCRRDGKKRKSTHLKVVKRSKRQCR